MKTLMICLLTLWSLAGLAQTPYEKAMTEGLASWKTGKSQEAMATFERVAQVEKDNWIPKYYQAMVGITNSFMMTNNEEKLKAIDAAKALIPKDEKSLNAEWYVLNALALTSELTIDPMATAMTLSPQIMEQYQKALALEPNNPRALSGMADFSMQSKKFMGGDTKAECKQLEKAVSLFDKEKNATKFYPSWGKERAAALLASCKN